MGFTVTWTQTAQNQLADIWVRSQDRQRVTEAAHRIDLILKAHPELVGRPRPHYRLLAVPPLVIAYTISPDDCLVRVLQVAR